MSGVKVSNIIKRSVSFSPTVNEWAEQMARERGHENNFSAFLAELVREARDRETKLHDASSSPANSGDTAFLKQKAAAAAGKTAYKLKRRSV